MFIVRKTSMTVVSKHENDESARDAVIQTLTIFTIKARVCALVT
jgi:hypothetical protein